MKRTLLAALFASSGLVAAVVGCNAILGNEAGILASSDASVLTDAPVVTTDTGPNQPSDAGGCASGQKECGGVCVNVTDPSVGCGGECNPCSQLANGMSKCGLSNDQWICTLGDCTAGYADCDQKAADGCESSLSGKHSCGSCALDCVDAGHAFCQPGTGGGGPLCTDVCNSPSTNCCGNAQCGSPNDPAGDCVDTSNDNGNCGSCGHTCMSQFPNATDAVCAGSACTFTTCAAGFAKCSNACVTDSNAKCGANCADCRGTTNPVCDSMQGKCVAANCVAGKVFCPANNGACVTEDNTHCGSTCASCGVGTHCDLSAHSCMPNPPMCNNGKVVCGAGCTPGQGSCGADGCIDPTSSPSCGGGCQPANDCGRSATPQACCPSGGGTSTTYSCMDYDAGDDDSGPIPATCNP